MGSFNSKIFFSITSLELLLLSEGIQQIRPFNLRNVCLKDTKRGYVASDTSNKSNFTDQVISINHSAIAPLRSHATVSTGRAERTEEPSPQKDNRPQQTKCKHIPKRLLLSTTPAIYSSLSTPGTNSLRLKLLPQEGHRPESSPTAVHQTT